MIGKIGRFSVPWSAQAMFTALSSALLGALPWQSLKNQIHIRILHEAGTSISNALDGLMLAPASFTG